MYDKDMSEATPTQVSPSPAAREPKVPDFVAKEAKKRTIYDASATEIFFKNFLAGIAHAAGSILIYLIFASGMLLLAFRFVYPLFSPYLDIYKQSMESLQMMNTFFPGGATTPQMNDNNAIDTPAEQERVEAELEQRYSPQQLQQAEQLLEEMQRNNN